MSVLTSKVISMSEAAALVPDGAKIGFGGGNALWRRPVAFARELVRQRRRDLNLYNMIGGIETDLLLGAGCLASTNTCYVGLDEFGQSEHFQRAARNHSIDIVEYTEFTLVASLRAAAMGLPFMPWKTGWGTDIAQQRGWATVKCPYTGIELLAIPANRLDFAVIQAVRCDEWGNVELMHPLDFIYDFDLLTCKSATTVIVCVEEVAALKDPSRSGLVSREVDYIVESRKGGWPGGFVPEYDIDAQHLRDVYVPASRSSDAFGEYLDRWVRNGPGE
jgi:glutaconate CoA-transferase, subunit A